MQPAQPQGDGQLAQNLRQLASRQPDLVRRIGLPVDDAHVVQAEDGRVYLRRQQSALALDLEREELAPSLAHVPPAGDAHVFGIGLGEQLDALLRSRPNARITAWERDPWLLRLALMRHDWTKALRAGRLRLRLGVDLLSDARDRRSSTRVLHPRLQHVYTLEQHLCEHGGGRPLAALALGGLFVDDLARALRLEGYDVFPLDLASWSLEELAWSIEAARPQLVASINYTSGLAEFCQAHSLPLLCWEIDPTTDRDVRLEAEAPLARVFTWRKRNVATFRAAGFTHVEHLPLAADEEHRRPVELSPDEAQQYTSPVAFVGLSMVPEARDFRRRFLLLHQAWRPEESLEGVDERVQTILDAQRLDGSSYQLPVLYEASFGAFARAMEARGTAEDPELLLAEVAAAEKRLQYVSRLGAYGVHVWGDQAWEATAAYGARYRGPAGHTREVNRIYAGACINVDVGRLYQQDIVTMRVFDVLACGGFLIAERSEELHELFDVGSELEDYRTLAELEEKVRHFLAHPGEARAIAAAGMQAVRERHTIRQRLRHMLDRAALSQAGTPAGQIP